MQATPTPEKNQAYRPTTTAFRVGPCDELTARGRGLMDRLGVDPERDRRISMAQRGSFHVDRNARQEERGYVDVPEIVDAGMGE
ncbi:hypothetical protein GCM10009780_74330 [Actinomadura alba]